MLINSRYILFLTLLWSSAAYNIPLNLWKPEHLYKDALEAILGIGVRLQALLEDPTVVTGENFMVSPLSAALLISQLMLGAEGKFREDLFNLLSLPEASGQKNSVIRYNKTNMTYTLPYAQLHLQMRDLVTTLESKGVSKSFKLTSSNGLFVDSKIKLNPVFKQLLGIYDTDIKPLNFSTDPYGTQKFINDWVSQQTNGLIKTILTTPLPASSSAILTNAVYFAADWETPFSYETNMKGLFHTSADKTVKVEYMQGFLENIQYAESAKLGCKMMALPYKNNELAMYFIMPFDNSTDVYDLRKFGQNIRTKTLLEFISQTKEHSVSVLIPKMKLTNRISLLEPLQRYAAFEDKLNNGLINNDLKNKFDILDKRVDIFNSFNTSEASDILLSKATDDQPLKVSNIIQEMTLSVDEKGTEAAAVTASLIEYMGGSKNFRVDKPFLFFIRHTATSAVLFWGAIVDPTQS